MYMNKSKTLESYFQMKANECFCVVFINCKCKMLLTFESGFEGKYCEIM